MSNPARDMVTILICPISKGPLLFQETSQELISMKAGLAYPVRQGIPIMLADQARALTAEEIAKYAKD